MTEIQRQRYIDRDTDTEIHRQIYTDTDTDTDTDTGTDTDYHLERQRQIINSVSSFRKLFKNEKHQPNDYKMVFECV